MLTHQKSNTTAPTEIPAQRATATAPRTTGGIAATRTLALLRIATGFVSLWAFLDKLLGLGYSTPSAAAWINGGSPTKGFLGHVNVGPFAAMFHGWAGAEWADWLFVLGLAGIGIAVLTGVALRIAALSGTVMLLLMWAAEWPLAQHHHRATQRLHQPAPRLPHHLRPGADRPRRHRRRRHLGARPVDRPDNPPLPHLAALTPPRPARLLNRLGEAAAAEQARLVTVTDPADRAELARVIARAELLQEQNLDIWYETDRWSGKRPGTTDGVPDHAPHWTPERCPSTADRRDNAPDRHGAGDGSRGQLPATPSWMTPCGCPLFAVR